MAVEKLITEHIDTWTSALKTRSTAGRGSNGKIDLYGIKKLRELILELAVRGKLVPQDPNDEPASELLKRIAAEKAELLKQGKIKKQKPLPEISEHEKPFELPVGWEWTSLSDIAAINPKIEVTDDEQKISFVPMPCISTRFDGAHDQEIKEWGEVKKGYTHFADGDIALAKITPCFENSKAAILKGLKGGVGVGTTELHVARPYSSELNLQYILLNIKSPHYLNIGESQMTGSAGQKRVPRSFFENYPLPFPSSAEQTRIVAIFSKLMFLCDQLEQQSLTSLDAHQQLVETLLSTLSDSQNAEELAENWALISQHFDTLFTTEASIDALKQTILQLAVMGKLVPQDPNDEPASELLKRIEQEKAQLVKEGKIKKHPPVEPLGEPALLPRSWLNIVVQDFADIRLGSTPDRSEKKYWNGDIPWVSSGEVANEVILDTKEKITSEGFKNSSTSMIPTGSLLMAIIGQGKTRGQTAILGIDACTNQNVAAFVFNQVHVEPEYVWIWAKSKYLSHRGDGHGGAQPALNGKKVRSFIFPLAPIKEQQRIVSEVKRFNDICDTLKSRLQSVQKTQLHLADALTDAALN
ncbi:restriction endonuclease subunit S [Serratia proteamaculans]|uniref:restriction endonuclease subunit S n=1 Tax=Serratia proteamaculans TaxID=28151 RepID=UPI000EC626B6|nr:restriction endonuclease [Serratia sp. (in: enterobacteria)]